MSLFAWLWLVYYHKESPLFSLGNAKSLSQTERQESNFEGRVDNWIYTFSFVLQLPCILLIFQMKFCESISESSMPKVGMKEVVTLKTDLYSHFWTFNLPPALPPPPPSFPSSVTLRRAFVIFIYVIALYNF